jgi:hypothetical protein
VLLVRCLSPVPACDLLVAEIRRRLAQGQSGVSAGPRGRIAARDKGSHREGLSQTICYRHPRTTNQYCVFKQTSMKIRNLPHPTPNNPKGHAYRARSVTDNCGIDVGELLPSSWAAGLTANKGWCMGGSVGVHVMKAAAVWGPPSMDLTCWA